MNILWSLVILLLLCRDTFSVRDIKCSDPDSGGAPARGIHKKFIIFGSEGSEGAGLGNLLIFFPAMYYFAAFTGREIIIADKSIIGEMCQIVTCGFPFLSGLSSAFPQVLNEEKIRTAEHVKAMDFRRYIESTREMDNPIVKASGYQAMSDWWVYYNTTAACVKKITGCDIGDVGCADRHAFQRLIRGPFRESLSGKEEQRIHGIPDHTKHAMLSLPHAYAPRLDAAIHLRTQFHHFEKNTDVNDPAYKEEVKNWLNSSECHTVFSSMEAKLIELLTESRKADTADAAATGSAADKQILPPPASAVSASVSSSITPPESTTSTLAAMFSTSSSTSSPPPVLLPASGPVVVEATGNKSAEPVYVYLAGDNEDVKESFAKILEQRHDEHFTIKVMRVDANFIHHVKNLAKLKQATNNEGVLDLVFDWYALSLANVILAWRKGSTSLISTFVHSAQRVSGTTERTDITGPLGHGVGTKGLQLMKDKRGNPRWDYMWGYTFLEDYQLPAPAPSQIK